MWKYKLLFIILFLLPVTAKAAVVVDHIEYFTFSFGSGSATDTYTLSATLTDKNKSFMIFSNSNQINSPSTALVSGEITNTTTLTFTKASAGGTTAISGWVIEFSSGVVVEHGEFTYVDDSPSTTVLSAITDISKSFVIGSGHHTGSTYGADDTWALYLDTSGSDKRVNAVGGTSVNGHDKVEWQVVQYDDCTVQRGSTSMTSSETSKAVSITTIDSSKAFLNSYLATDGSVSNIEPWMINAYFSSTSEITFERFAHSSQAVDDIRWEVVEFTGGEQVQEVPVAFAASDTQEDSTISAISLGDTIALTSYMQGRGSSDYASDDIPGESWYEQSFTSTTNLRASRLSSNSAADVTFYTIDFSGGGGPPPAGGLRNLGLTGAGL